MSDSQNNNQCDSFEAQASHAAALIVGRYSLSRSTISGDNYDNNDDSNYNNNNPILMSMASQLSQEFYQMENTHSVEVQKLSAENTQLTDQVTTLEAEKEKKEAAEG